MKNEILGYCECCGIEIGKKDTYALIDGYYYCNYCGGEDGLTIRELKQTYEYKKARAREKAMQWQREFGEHNYSYGELYEFGIYFEKLGKRYGLLKEFRENGIC
jgi:hypothetical protein